MSKECISNEGIDTTTNIVGSSPTVRDPVANDTAAKSEDNDTEAKSEDNDTAAKSEDNDTAAKSEDNYTAAKSEDNDTIAKSEDNDIAAKSEDNDSGPSHLNSIVSKNGVESPEVLDNSVQSSSNKNGIESNCLMEVAESANVDQLETKSVGSTSGRDITSYSPLGNGGSKANIESSSNISATSKIININSGNASVGDDHAHDNISQIESPKSQSSVRRSLDLGKNEAPISLVKLDVGALRREIDELEERYGEVSERLAEYEAICERFFPEEPSTWSASKLCKYILDKNEMIEDLKAQLSGAGKNSLINGSGGCGVVGQDIVEMAERELRLMEDLIKQQEVYISSLEADITTD